MQSPLTLFKKSQETNGPISTISWSKMATKSNNWAAILMMATIIDTTQLILATLKTSKLGLPLWSMESHITSIKETTNPWKETLKRLRVSFPMSARNALTKKPVGAHFRTTLVDIAVLEKTIRAVQGSPCVLMSFQSRKSGTCCVQMRPVAPFLETSLPESQTRKVCLKCLTEHSWRETHAILSSQIPMHLITTTSCTCVSSTTEIASQSWSRERVWPILSLCMKLRLVKTTQLSRTSISTYFGKRLKKLLETSYSESGITKRMGPEKWRQQESHMKMIQRLNQR